MALSVVPTAAQTEVPEGVDGPATAAAEMVYGVLSYTRWPTADGPVRLCLAGQSRLMARMTSGVLPSGRRVLVSRRTAATVPGEGCDAVFVGSATAGELSRIARTANGAALVTMTDSDAECGTGFMICLRRTSTGMTFDLSIDAVSRSAVRIDPRVLMLATRGGRP